MLAEAAGIGLWSYEPLTELIEWSPRRPVVHGPGSRRPGHRQAVLDRLPIEQRETGAQGFHQAVRTGQGGTVEFRLRGAADQWFTCAPPIAPSRWTAACSR
jgi:hypothetical protein